MDSTKNFIIIFLNCRLFAPVFHFYHSMIIFVTRIDFFIRSNFYLIIPSIIPSINLIYPLYFQALLYHLIINQFSFIVPKFFNLIKFFHFLNSLNFFFLHCLDFIIILFNLLGYYSKFIIFQFHRSNRYLLFKYFIFFQ